eukprot:6952393-Karenia_brevis.AAC.1
MASSAEELPSISAQIAGESYVVERVNGMEILGAWIEQNGSTTQSFEHRAAKAEKAFWADKDVLLNKAVPLNVRMRRYSQRIVPRMLHSSGSWTWCQGLCQKLAVWEGKLLRRMMGAARRPDDTWLKWFQRATRAARSYYDNMGCEPLTLKVLREIHRTAALIRLPGLDDFAGSRATTILLSDAIEWRDTSWWHVQQALGQILDPLNRNCWRHAANVGTEGTPGMHHSWNITDISGENKRVQISGLQPLR